MSARTFLIAMAIWAAGGSLAQAPSWNTPDGRNSSLPKPQPSGVVRNAGNTTAAAANALQPPRDRDCKATITRPEGPYATKFSNWYTDGTEDHGQILNAVAGAAGVVQSDLNDMQVRIEQLRCEQENIKAKLDYLIRTK